MEYHLSGRNEYKLQGILHKERIQNILQQGWIRNCQNPNLISTQLKPQLQFGLIWIFFMPPPPPYPIPRHQPGTRRWPKPKSSGLNQELTRKKASRFKEFSSSCWYPVISIFRLFGLTRNLAQPRRFCLLPKLHSFYQEVFMMIGQFSNIKNGHKMLDII